jgi:hypothetical protein
MDPFRFEAILPKLIGSKVKWKASIESIPIIAGKWG